jgi:hypothetical protein
MLLVRGLGLSSSQGLTSVVYLFGGGDTEAKNVMVMLA